MFSSCVPSDRDTKPLPRLSNKSKSALFFLLLPGRLNGLVINFIPPTGILSIVYKL